MPVFLNQNLIFVAKPHNFTLTKLTGTVNSEPLNDVIIAL